MILKRMKRRHSRADTIAFCETVRRVRPDVAFGADFIAGFPTETEEMFENTMKLVDDAGLVAVFAEPDSAPVGSAAWLPLAGTEELGLASNMPFVPHASDPLTVPP